MTVISNTDPAKINLYAVKGDTIDISFYVNYELTGTGKKFYVQANSSPVSGAIYNLGTLNIQVRRKDGLLLKDWLSGISPSDIVVTGNHFHLFDSDGFLESGFFDFDIQEFDGISGFKTIARGLFHIQKETTI